MSDDVKNAVQIQHLNPDYYLHEQLHARRNQIAESISCLRNNDEAHFHALAESFRSDSQVYASGMMTLSPSSAISLKGSAYATVVYNDGSMKLPKDDYCMVMINGRHWTLFVKLLRFEEGLEWTVETLRLYNAFPVEGKLIFSAQKIELSRIARIQMDTVQQELMFTDAMQSLLSHLQAFE